MRAACSVGAIDWTGGGAPVGTSRARRYPSRIDRGGQAGGACAGVCSSRAGSPKITEKGWRECAAVASSTAGKMAAGRRNEWPLAA